MSLELVGLPDIKVHCKVHALLKAQSASDKLAMNELVREILHGWFYSKVGVISMADDILKSKDLPVISGDWSLK